MIDTTAQLMEDLQQKLKLAEERGWNEYAEAIKSAISSPNFPKDYIYILSPVEKQEQKLKDKTKYYWSDKDSAWVKKPEFM